MDNTYGGGLLDLGLDLLHSSLNLNKHNVSFCHNNGNGALEMSPIAPQFLEKIRHSCGYETGLGWIATCLLRRASLLGLGDTDGLGASGLCSGLSPRLARNGRSSVGSVKNSRLGVASRRARALSCHCAGLLWELGRVETRQ